MTLIHTYPGADFSNSNVGSIRKFIDADKRQGLVGEYLFGRNAGTSVVNLANAQKPATAIGNPTFGAHDALVGQSNWFDTGLFDTPEVTLLSIGNAQGMTADTSVWQISTFNGSNGGTTTGLDAFNGVLRGLASGAQSTQALRGAFAEYTAKALRVAVLSSSSYSVTVSEYHAGALVNSTSTTANTARVPDISAPFAIGSARGSSSAAFRDAGAAIWTRSLSDAELLAQVASVTTLMAKYGIVV